jgi:hypothetical protein
MCVVSMVMDHYVEKWDRTYPKPPTWVPYIPATLPATLPVRSCDYPSKEEIAEFRRLLDRAREYDKRNNEPDCENAGKKQLLKEMAKRLGVDISFIDE